MTGPARKRTADHRAAGRVIDCPSCGTRNRLPVSVDSKTGHPRCASCHTDLPWLVEVGNADFDSATRTSLPVLVDLWAPWCGPCRVIAPGVEQASRDFAGRLKVLKVNVDHAPQIAGRFKVQGVPTLLILQDGKVVDTQVGALPTNQLLAWVRGHV